MWGPTQLNKLTLAQAKQLGRDVEEHFRAVVRFLMAFAMPFGIDASPLSVGVDECVLLLRIEAAIQATIHKQRSGVPSTRRAARMSSDEAAPRLERLRSQGEEFQTQRHYETEFGCSLATINKALKTSEALKAWSGEGAASPRTQSLTPIVLDKTKDAEQLSPSDEAAIRGFIEDAGPADKAWFLGLSIADQLDFIYDPDKYGKILGRKP